MITDAYAGPRLAALIRSVQAFIPRQFWVAYLSNHDEMLPYYENETAAIGRGDEAAARGACVDRTELMGRIMLAELVRRGCCARQVPHRLRSDRAQHGAARC